MAFTPEEANRYVRHFNLPEVGMAGQQKIKLSSVLVVGVGGLGCPAAMYLAAAGIGRLGLVDFDRVEASNLQRQVLFEAGDVGRAKVDVAKERLLRQNPNVAVETFEMKLTKDNAETLIQNYDYVIDATDNFSARYAINDGCIQLGKPWIYGSIHRFEGQLSVFDSKRGPCYRCLYPTPLDSTLTPNCAEAGVLGVLPGVVGSLQASEVIKLILGKGKSLVGRILHADLLNLSFHEIQVEKNSACEICGTQSAPQAQVKPTIPTMMEISPSQLNTKLKSGWTPRLLDVRNPNEFEYCRLNGATLIPLNELPIRFKEIPKDADIVVYCHLGIRSKIAAQFLSESGLMNVFNLTGGIDEWSKEIDMKVPRY